MTPGSLAATVTEIVGLVLLLEGSVLATGATMVRAERVLEQAVAASELAQVLRWANKDGRPEEDRLQRLSGVSVTRWSREPDGTVVIEVFVRSTNVTVRLRQEP